MQNLHIILQLQVPWVRQKPYKYYLLGWFYKKVLSPQLTNVDKRATIMAFLQSGAHIKSFYGLLKLMFPVGTIKVNLLFAAEAGAS